MPVLRQRSVASDDSAGGRDNPTNRRPPSILALVFGYVAKQQIDQSAGQQVGRGMAVAGIVLGWVWIGILLTLILVGVSIR